MLNRRISSPANPIAIDLGGFRTRFYSASEGLLLDEPSIGALDIDHKTGGAEAINVFGNDAEKNLTGKNDHLSRVQPVQSDHHNELGLSQKMLAHFIATATRSGRLPRASEIHLVLPDNVDDLHADKLVQTCIKAGASEVYCKDAALAAFYGSSLDVSQPGVLIDFGATDSRLIAIADNEVKCYQSLSIGGDNFDQAIRNGLIEQFDLYISETDAREVKHRIAAATTQSFVQHTRDSIQLDCLSLARNSTTQFRVSSDSVNEFLAPLLAELTNTIRLAFAGLDDQVKDAAFNNAIQLCGGGALISRMDQLVMRATDLPVEVVSRPLTCSVRGAARQLTGAAEPLDLTEVA